jgi:chromosome segregation ATPase
MTDAETEDLGRDEERIHELNRRIAGPLKDVVSHCKKITELDKEIFELEEKIRDIRAQRRNLYEQLDSVVKVP